MNTNYPNTSANMSSVASALADKSLGFAKSLASLLGGGITLACSASALGLLAAACYFIIQFSEDLTVALPPFAAGIFHVTVIQGGALVLGSMTSALIAVLFLLAAVALAKGISAMWRVPTPQIDRT